MSELTIEKIGDDLQVVVDKYIVTAEEIKGGLALFTVKDAEGNVYFKPTKKNTRNEKEMDALKTDMVLTIGSISDFDPAIDGICAEIVAINGTVEAELDFHSKDWGLPGFELSTVDLHQNINTIEDALLTARGGPYVFQGINALCSVIIEKDETVEKGIVRPCDAAHIQYLDKVMLGRILTKYAAFGKYDGRSKKVVRILQPQAAVLNAVISSHMSRQPKLVAITSAPFMRKDGSIHETPGYDPISGYYYANSGLVMDPIPTKPSWHAAVAAYQTLIELFRDFPFINGGESAMIAMLLSILARPALGNVPIFAVTATAPGTGKTLAVDIISMIALGRIATKMPESLEEDEERKRLLAAMLSGDPLLCIDNIQHPLGSASLDAALTSGSFSDRVLGKSELKKAELTAVMCATGNNLSFKGDTRRRAVLVQLQSDEEDPEERSDFEHERIVKYVEENRGKFVTAALVILSAYVTAGSPLQPGIRQMGSFEEWNELVRHGLIWVGAEDPLKGKDQIKEQIDPELETLSDLLRAWNNCLPDNSKQGYTMKAIDLAIKAALQPQGNSNERYGERLTEEDRLSEKANRDNFLELRDALGGFDRNYKDGHTLNLKAVAYILRNKTGRVVDGLRLMMGNKTKQGVPWRVESVGEKEPRE